MFERLSFTGWVILAVVCGLMAWGASELFTGQSPCGWHERCFKPR